MRSRQGPHQPSRMAGTVMEPALPEDGYAKVPLPEADAEVLLQTPAGHDGMIPSPMHWRTVCLLEVVSIQWIPLCPWTRTQQVQSSGTHPKAWLNGHKASRGCPRSSRESGEVKTRLRPLLPQTARQAHGVVVVVPPPTRMRRSLILGGWDGKKAHTAHTPPTERRLW
eukprot:g19113.t1